MAIFAVPKRDDSLAQQVEHNTFNVGVLGSSPRRITKKASGNRSLFCLCILRRNSEMQPPVHTGGAQRGSSVPGGDFCPRLGVFLWMPQRNAPACPRRRCLAWTHGAQRWHLSTDGGVFVDTEEKYSRLSTEMVPGVDVRCPEVTFVHGRGCFCGCRREMQPPVHAGGAWRGRTVPGGDFCPRRGCLAWTYGARRDKCYFNVIVSPGFTSPLIIFSASGSSM